MGRAGSLTADPVRLAGSAAGGLALRRLDRAASWVAPLRTGDRGLAVLTCRRLESLLAPRRGDDALAAALVRYDARAGAEPAPLERTRAVARNGAGRARAGAPPARAPQLPALSPRVRSDGPPSRGRPSAREDARTQHEPAVASDVARSGPHAGVAWADPKDVRGLEWLMHDAPAVAEAAAAPLDLEPSVAPAVADRSPEPELRAPAAPAAHPVSPEHAERDVRTASAIDALRTLAPVVRHDDEDVREPVRPEHAGHPGRAQAGTGQLASLVRAWDDPPPLDEPRRDTAPPAMPAHQQQTPSPDRLDEPRTAASADDRPAPAAVADAPAGEHELLGFGDQLGRVLVAELRRYGIEVET